MINVPVPWFRLLAFCVAFFLSFFGLMVSVLSFDRTVPLPSLRVPPDLSPVPIADCGIEGTVSVSTVMPCLPSPCRDFTDESGVKLFVCVDFGRDA